MGFVDEVRYSDVVRYTSLFKPAYSHFQVRNTLVLFHFDTDSEAAILDVSTR